MLLVFCFSYNVRQCKIGYSVVHVQLCLKITFVYYYYDDDDEDDDDDDDEVYLNASVLRLKYSAQD